MFEQREIAPAVWVPIRSLGPAVRKGRNSLRIEFEPADALAGYHARLSWALVNDQAAEKSSEGAVTSTNQSGEGTETKQGKGKVVLEREFEADFAADQPWHHYPPVASVSEEDRHGPVHGLSAATGGGAQPGRSLASRVLKNDKASPSVQRATRRTCPVVGALG